MVLILAQKLLPMPKSTARAESRLSTASAGADKAICKAAGATATVGNRQQETGQERARATRGSHWRLGLDRSLQGAGALHLQIRRTGVPHPHRARQSC
jgi:hypothetical protein